MVDVIKAAEKLVKSAKVSIIGSIDEQGFPNIKAMLAPRKLEGLKTVYFSTNTSSQRVGQFLVNPKASLYFYQQETFQGVLLLGEMAVLTDKAIKELIWQAGDELYYPLGVTDPDYCVLKFVAVQGRFYQNFTSVDFRLD